MDIYLTIAVAAAKKGGKIFKTNFGKVKNAEQKNANYRNLVTSIDKKIEAIIKTEIVKKFPDHNFLGEESGLSGKKSKLIWIVDPIDGTTNFIQGLPLCCISVALWDEKGPLVGVVYDPLREKLYTSYRGRGAFLNGKRIFVSDTKKIHDSVGCVGWIEPEDGIKIFGKLVKPARKVRVLATSVLTAAFIAQGTFDFYTVDKIFIWDFAAGAAIVLEAGGKITDFQGKPFTIHSKSAVLSNGKIHSELIQKLKSR